ncbi:gp16 family protein [Dongia deserti]|uniref:gp16 family protein n=1 Tax=Dongia deserti TaxID=2268030 RepID=UPI000E65B6F4|nr:regulatory protein GemA [Dongia deserti]
MSIATDVRRKKELAKIHLAKKALGLDDDTYRSLLIRVAGKDSAGDLDQAGRTKVLDYFKAKGFDDRRIKRAGPGSKSGARPLAEGAEASKMRALWLALFQLGEVQESGEAALAKYAERMTGKAALQWLDQRDVAKVINTLRAWCGRLGFLQPNSFHLDHINSRRREAMLEEVDTGFAAKCALLLTLWKRAGNTIADGAPIEAWLRIHYRVEQVWMMTSDGLDDAIAALGAVVRRQKRRRAERA